MKITIIRRKRRSVTLKMLSAEEGVVFAPVLMKKSEIDAFIHKHNTWILKQQVKLLAQNQQLQDNLLNFAPMMFGKKVYAHLSDNKNIEFDNSLENSIPIKGIVLTKYKKHCHKTMQEVFNRCLNTANQSCKKLSFRSMKRSWGNCNHKKEIKLNTKIVMLPLNLMEYVMFHEICHLTHMNHSTQFWKSVEKFVPHYKTAKKEMKHYAYLLDKAISF